MHSGSMGWFVGGVWMLLGQLLRLIAFLVGAHPRVETRLLYVSAGLIVPRL